MKNSKFYLCPHCGNLVEMVCDAGVKPFCCGRAMDELNANSVEASGEKHVPAVVVKGDVVEVNVGSVDHPMADVHYIEWVELRSEKGVQRRYLKPGEAPHAVFHLSDDKPLVVYAYCNLHGLWKAEI